MKLSSKDFVRVISQPQRLIIDCSHAVRRGHRAGVQRVVWNLVDQAMKRSLNQTSPFEYQCTVVHAGRFHRYDPARPLKSALMRENIFAYLPKHYRRVAEQVHRVMPSSLVQKMLLPKSGKLGVFRPWYGVQERLDRRRMARDTSWRQPGRGDVLLMADSYWCRPQVWPAVDEARRRGAVVVTLVYDLIPMTHPQFVRPGTHADFEAYLHAVATHSDTIVAISKAVADECRHQIELRWPDRLPALTFSHFCLGADLPAAHGQPSPAIRSLFATNHAPYLMVSTFDPRKNHAYLLDTFERLWQRMPEAKLCLVGGRGWLSADLLNRIDHHPRLNQQLFKFHSLDDSDLRYCYQHARAVICPSTVEGFGLPVVEALAHGRMTFVSDIPVHREVGADECEYFDLADPLGLLHKLQSWEEQVERGTSPERDTRQPTTWQASAAQLFEQCEYQWKHRSAAGPLVASYLKSA